MDRVALIDLGSNNARLVIYDVFDSNYFTVFYETHETVRLGETEPDGSLKQTRIIQAISTLKTFKQICGVYQVDKVIAFATAAVRRAGRSSRSPRLLFQSCRIRLFGRAAA